MKIIYSLLRKFEFVCLKYCFFFFHADRLFYGGVYRKPLNFEFQLRAGKFHEESWLREVPSHNTSWEDLLLIVKLILGLFRNFLL